MALVATRARHRAPARLSRLPSARELSWVTWTFLGLLAAYALLTAAILLKSPVLDLDDGIRNLGLRHTYPWTYKPLHSYVTLGERVPVIKYLLPWLAFISWRRRSFTPLLSMYVSVVVLNLSVGTVKILTGRQGPRGGHPVDQFFAGGDIYPSGHTSNSVALWGLVAIFAAVKYRKAVIALLSTLIVTIGASTLVINTHWLTDVVGGWLAGGLVLCTLPWIVPVVERVLAPYTSRTRGVISLLGGALPMYFNVSAITQLLGHWLNNVFGGKLALGLILCTLPWVSAPIEVWVRRHIRAARQRRALQRAAAADVEAVQAPVSVTAAEVPTSATSSPATTVGAHTAKPRHVTPSRALPAGETDAALPAREKFATPLRVS